MRAGRLTWRTSMVSLIALALLLALGAGTCDAPADTSATAATTETLTADRAALVALYRATRGPLWTNNRNWLTEAPVFEWHGVTTDDSGRVTELRLDENALLGKIPARVGPS